MFRVVARIFVPGLLLFSFVGTWAQSVPAPSAVQSDKTTAKKKPRTEPYANITAIGVSHDNDGPAIEIVSTHPLSPAIKELDSPHRLVIDLPKAILTVRDKRMEVQKYQISTIRADQYQSTPPVTRVVVDLEADVGYSWDSSGNRLLVHLKPIEDARRFAAPTQGPSVVGFSAGTQPVATAENPGMSGAVLQANEKAGSGSTVTAGADTTVLRMTRGGEVRVCPGTTVSISASTNGSEVMLGMSTGALETHYKLGPAADSIMTPDFRILLPGPGEFHYAISADTQGNTCVRALMGNTASAVVSELMGDRTYQVKPTDQLVFHAGRLDNVDSNVPLECGCPPPGHPVQRASTVTMPEIPEAALEGPKRLTTVNTPAKPPTNPSSMLSVGGPEAAKEPPPQVNLSVIDPKDSAMGKNSGQVQVSVEAPIVFRGTDPQPAPTQEAEILPPVSNARQVTMTTVEIPAPAPVQPAPPPKPAHHGLFGKVKGFFATVFR